MLKASCAAGLLAGTFTSESTTASPRMRRASSTIRPTSTRHQPAARTATRRHPCAIHTASSNSPIASSGSTIARPLMAFAMFCAVFSCEERRITMLPVVGGSFTPSFASALPRATAPLAPVTFDSTVASCSLRPTCEASCSSSGCSLSTTSPFSVEIVLLPPLRIRSSSCWAVRLASRQACCTLPVASTGGCELDRERAQPRGRGGGERGHFRGKHLLDFLGHVHVVEQFVHEQVAHRLLHLRVGEQLRARVRPVVGVQQLPVDPHGEHREHADDDGAGEGRVHPPSSCAPWQDGARAARSSAAPRGRGWRSARLARGRLLLRLSRGLGGASRRSGSVARRQDGAATIPSGIAGKLPRHARGSVGGGGGERDRRARTPFLTARGA